MASLSSLRRKAPIFLTDNAIRRVKELMGKKPSAIGLKVGVRKRGCNGLSYTMNYVETPDKKDDIIKQNDLTVFVEPKSLLFLVGTTMDYVETDTTAEFVFVNPNAKSKCGCGESFNV